jgi:hypothetical protein
MHLADIFGTNHEKHDKNILILCKLFHSHQAQRKKSKSQGFLEISISQLANAVQSNKTETVLCDS